MKNIRALYAYSGEKSKILSNRKRNSIIALMELVNRTSENDMILKPERHGQKDEQGYFCF